MSNAVLLLVPTPIGNMEDITYRAVRMLKEADLILAEDTRHTSKLLKHYNIENKLQSFHQHNEHKMLEKVLDMLKSGMTVAAVTDAGTPGISDPGFLLVRACVEENIRVECLPGATAFVLALVNSGLPSDRFCFEGFLPHKKGRQQRLQELAAEQRTMIFYESPYRLLKALKEMAVVFGEERPASVSRELTKLHEEVVRGPLADLLVYFSEKETIKGEIVIVVRGADK